MDTSLETIHKLLDCKTNEEISHGIANNLQEVNRFLFSQFVAGQWQQHNRTNKCEDSARRIDDEVLFVNSFFEPKRVYFNSFGFNDDLLINVLSFISDDDKLIHESIVKINKRFNNIIKNNYASPIFNYQPDFRQFLIKQNELMKYFGKYVDFRLSDGYWISDVLVQQYCESTGPEKVLDFSLDCFGIPTVETRSQYEREKIMDPEALRRRALTCYFDQQQILMGHGNHFPAFAQYGSMTKRPLLKSINKYAPINFAITESKSKVNRINNESHVITSMSTSEFCLCEYVAVDVKIFSENIALYINKSGYDDDQVDNVKDCHIAQLELFQADFDSYSVDDEWFHKREWMCGIIDKDETISTNGQICLLIDIRQDDYFGTFSNDELENYMQNNNVVNIVKKPTAIKQYKNKNNVTKNTGTNVYFVKYWAQLDNHNEISPFATKSSVILQQKMKYTIYSLHGVTAIDGNVSDNLDSAMSNGEQLFEFDSLCYNGKYINDSIDLTNGESKRSKNNLLIATKNNDMIVFDKIKGKMINKYCSCHYCQEDCYLCNIKGFITQRPIIFFDINNLFDTPFYNEKNKWKLMIQVKLNHLWIKNIAVGNHESQFKFIDININNKKQDVNDCDNNENNCQIWKDGQIIDIWKDCSSIEKQDKEYLIKKFENWNGQVKVRLDIKNEIEQYVNSNINGDIDGWNNLPKIKVYKLLAEKSDTIQVEETFQGEYKIFYHYFVHLDDFRFVRKYVQRKQ